MSAALCSAVTITPAGARWRTELEELWRYRELLLFLAWRDLRVRYRQTLLGATWAFCEPLLNVLVFTLVFHRLAGVESGPPYPLYCCAGMLAYTAFSRGLRATTLSLTANAGLLTKAYFPRLVLPLAANLATFADLGCAVLMYAALACWYGYVPGLAVLTLPFWAALAAIISLGLGLALAAINVRFRDVSQAVPFLAQLWMLATPVGYPLSAVPPEWRGVYALNPLVGAVEGMRWCLLPGTPLPLAAVALSVGVSAVLLTAGLAVFFRAQLRFADIV
jgi:lipopolysaccharide transport system permease protein